MSSPHLHGPWCTEDDSDCPDACSDAVTGPDGDNPITDEQIQQLKVEWGSMAGDCNLALNLPDGFDRDQWRERCAAAWNARKSGGEK